MKAVMLEVDQRLLDERRRLGIDRWDEMWEGVLHMVPAPSGPHQRVSARLFLTLAPLAEANGLIPHFETALYRPGADSDYRIPDLMFASPHRTTQRGVDGGAELVVEIRSPDDESYAKLDWYADLGVREVLVIEPATMAVELFSGTTGGASPVAPDADGTLRSTVLAASLAPSGEGLRVSWDGGHADITAVAT